LFALFVDLQFAIKKAKVLQEQNKGSKFMQDNSTSGATETKQIITSKLEPTME
jgi:hypothetical protein